MCVCVHVHVRSFSTQKYACLRTNDIICYHCIHNIFIVAMLLFNTYSAHSMYFMYRLVIGLNCGLVIVDTVQSKFLLVEVNELDFIG